MSFRRINKTAQILLILMAALLATGALAGDKECTKERKHTQTITIDLDDDDVILTRNCGDDSRVVMVNLNAVEGIVSDVFDDVSEVLEELDEMQMEFHLGQDNKLCFADADTEWEVDLGQIATQVELALRSGLAEFEAEDWTSTHVRYSDDDELDALKDELDSLKREMKRLQKELKKSSEREN
ncbi:MAG: hypothetical protein KOO60_00625 [Gemmatimonadales bacterium]|nr:hypothetical protein [Gemmatimonadales bacterium]